MKLYWNGHGVIVHGAMILEWDYYDGASYYTIRSAYRMDRNSALDQIKIAWRTIYPVTLHIRVPDWPLQ